MSFPERLKSCVRNALWQVRLEDRNFPVYKSRASSMLWQLIRSCPASLVRGVRSEVTIRQSSEGLDR